MALPPSSAGAAKAAVAWVSPATAAPINGAPGGRANTASTRQSAVTGSVV